MRKRDAYILLAVAVALLATLACGYSKCKIEYLCCQDDVCAWKSDCNNLLEIDRGARECCPGRECKPFRGTLQSGW